MIAACRLSYLWFKLVGSVKLLGESLFCVDLINRLSSSNDFVTQGSYGQGKSGNFEGVRENQGKQRGSGKSQ